MDKEHFDETLEDLEELHNDELDDIVLEKYEKKNKIKKYLLIGGSIFLIFVIVISIVKIVTDSSSAPQEALIETEQSSQEVSSEENFEEVPIVSKEEKPSDEEFQKVINDVMKKEEKIATEPKQQAVASAKPSVTPKAKPAAKPTPAHHTTATKPVAKPKPKPKPKPAPKAKPKGDIYVQVGAFLHYDPNSAFLKKIKRSGFGYVIKEFTINGKKIKRVYIGPFASRKEAARYLPKIKKTISKNAFITKVK